MKFMFLNIAILVLLSISCKKDANTGGVTPPVVVIDTTLHKAMPFPMGAALNVNLLRNNAKYNAVATKEYNSVTAENVMKFAGIHPAQNTYNWTDSDYLVDFAKASGKRVHGHTLIWHNSQPTWLTNFVGDSTAWENLMKTHIQTVMTHFKGRVTSWDVVNEAFDDVGVLRNSIWRQKLGDDYVARCFQYAYQADSTVLLFYNDFGQENNVVKRNAITAMVTSFKNRGIPIHGIGLQFHISHTQSEPNISSVINAAAATGLKVHLSELDIKVNGSKSQTFVFTSTLAEQQAAKYKFVIKAYNAIPEKQKFGITIWNIGDADSWIPNFQGAPDFPLPFDVNYERKPAYKGIIDGLK